MATAIALSEVFVSDSILWGLKARQIELVFEQMESSTLRSSLRAGDTLVVTRLDCLARSTLDLLNIVKATAAKQANFLSLAEPWANTSTAIGKLMLTVLSGWLNLNVILSLYARQMVGNGRKRPV